jgi:hypothetical protein
MKGHQLSSNVSLFRVVWLGVKPASVVADLWPVNMETQIHREGLAERNRLIMFVYVA